jgi:hypothetical protein
MEETERSNSGLKILVVILLLLLLGSLGYMYKLINDSKQVEKALISEKESVLRDLSIAKDSLDAAISSNTVLSEDLIIERDKIVQLMAEIEKSKSDIVVLTKFKSQAITLKKDVSSLVKENNILKKENQLLAVQRDSTATLLGDVKKMNDTLATQNTYLSKTIEKASRLTVLNLQATAVRQKSSGKQINTDKASKADILKISFMIAENQVAKSGDKTYYVQVKDNKNNVLGEKNIFTVGDNSITYSFTSMVKYANKTLQVSKDLEVTNIEKGTFFVNIYDKDELVSNTSFVLK